MNEFMHYNLAEGLIFVISPKKSEIIFTHKDMSVLLTPQESKTLEVFLTQQKIHDQPIFQHLVHVSILKPNIMFDSIRYEKLVNIDTYFQFFELSEHEQKTLTYLQEAHTQRRMFLYTAGQLPLTPLSALKRALIVQQNLQATKAHIACIGDDDLVSIALASLGFRVTVFDIDHYLLNTIQNIATHYNLPIETQYYDAQTPIEQKHTHQYDAFVTDPMPNILCNELFISRGVQLCKKNSYGFIATHVSMLEQIKNLYKKMNLEPIAHHRRLHRYYALQGQRHDYDSDLSVIQMHEQSIATYQHHTSMPVSELYADIFDQQPACAVVSMHSTNNMHAIDADATTHHTSQEYHIFTQPMPNNHEALHAHLNSLQINIAPAATLAELRVLRDMWWYTFMGE